MIMTDILTDFLFALFAVKVQYSKAQSSPTMWMLFETTTHKTAIDDDQTSDLGRAGMAGSRQFLPCTIYTYR